MKGISPATLIALFSVGMSFPALGKEGPAMVRYDAESQRISIAAEDAPLGSVLREISQATGIEILVDPAIDTRVDVTVKAQPIENAMKIMLRNGNYVLKYGTRENVTYVTSIAVLPKGLENNPNLKPVRALNTASGRGRGGAASGMSASMTSDGAEQIKERLRLKQENSAWKMRGYGRELPPPPLPAKSTELAGMGTTSDMARNKDQPLDMKDNADN